MVCVYSLIVLVQSLWQSHRAVHAFRVGQVGVATRLISGQVGGNMSLNSGEYVSNKARKKIVVILGPTATGKTDASVEVAVKLKNHSIAAEIINADSMQIHNKMIIKVTIAVAMLNLVEHTTSELYEMLAAVDPERAAVLHKNDRKRIARSLYVKNLYGVKHSELIKRRLEVKKRIGPKYDVLIFAMLCGVTEHKRRIKERAQKMLQNGIIGECVQLMQLMGTP
ncbi:tRNA dimethylallyltransferase [Babesia caballi]|uniref:tRNA dimethylallyltransferase n=1 Tax=Babesia caballi TaxID=5871 RepID=A0AAV4LWE4_BABCB|nr:tRNA dimethylallyltransferase [Babesia caballi]